MNNNITIWSDKDGVIAVYEPHVYRPKDPNETPLFMIEGVHYYRNCEADTRIIEAYRLIQEEHPEIPFTVITNVVDITASKTLANKHKTDKHIWVSEKMPFLDMDSQFYAIQMPKYIKAEQLLNRKLRKTDILISDYNNDLIPWENAGGTSVKYLNGQNSADSFDGAKITPDMTPDEIKTFILNLSY